MAFNVLLNSFGKLFEEIASQGNANTTKKTDINILVLQNTAEVAAVAKHLTGEPGDAPVLTLKLLFNAVSNMKIILSHCILKV